MASEIQGVMAGASRTIGQLAKRIHIPLTATSPPGLVEALTVDPWDRAGKYGLGWTYFCLALMGSVLFVRIWHWWQDKIRQAIYKQDVERHYRDLYSLDPEQAMTAMQTEQPGRHFFPETNHEEKKDFKPRSDFSSITPVLDALALFRWVFYRPIPDLPLYWQSIQFGSPPVAIRAGMIAVAMTPWIIASSMKTNVLTYITGIGPERLNVFHRWAGYLCLFMSLVHTVPFYIQPVWDDGGMQTFSRLFPEGSGVIYGTGISCLVPLVWLCVASLPFIRRVAFEAFVVLHVPVGMVYVGLLFWHTKNFLASWSYLYSTIAIWAFCYALRLFKLNWTKPWRLAFMVGDEAAITLMTENAIKVTIPTQMRWSPGQYVYLRMPGISEDFPSEYGEQYRDCVLVFKPYGGFTRRVLETAIQKGPFHTYRAYLDGPYGGMRRELSAFDTCILIAGGSGITSLMSQLLNLIKRMRDGKAITKKVVVIWALKRLEAMDWFREELRICRESAPPESVTCKFFVTSAVRQRVGAGLGAGVGERAQRPLSTMFHDRLDGFVAGVASKRASTYIRDEAQGNVDYERELRAEDEDRITALPQQRYLQPHHEDSLRRLEGREDEHMEIQEDHGDAPPPPPPPSGFEYPEDKPKQGFQFPPLHLRPEKQPHFNYAPPSPRRFDGSNTQTPGQEHRSAEPSQDVPRPPEFAHLRTTNLPGQGQGQPRPTSTFGPPSGFDFGFPETPTEFQKSLMRFAFPVPHQIDGGWSVEYGRPDLGYMLKEWATGGTDGRGILGRRTAVFVCGPASMRVGVANTVARLQAEIWGDDMLEEIFLHTENYAL
ncbi:ferric reductase transmembrane component 7 [Apiospora hydei]|uniref:Ferric reductase transmembrane component 7 n=1 Tax=Apiospora hydei TaxID=1337664 RepID=A0ABR1VI34_9PEZI